MALAVTRSDIERIHPVIAAHIRRTPVVTISGADFGLPPFSLTLKLEQLQHAGSFKTRGAFANLLTRLYDWLTVPKGALVTSPRPGATMARLSRTPR